MAVGLPNKRTLVETVIHWIGFICVFIGVTLLLLTVIGIFKAYTGVSWRRMNSSILTIFILGMFVTFSGLFLAGFSQFLGSFRLKVHNSAIKENK